MLNLISQDGLADVPCCFLVIELGGVDADHNQFFGVFLFEVIQVWKDMHAVDAAEGPEVDQHDFATQVFDRDRSRRIQPFDTPFQFWSRMPIRKRVLDFFPLRRFGLFFHFCILTTEECRRQENAQPQQRNRQ